LRQQSEAPIPPSPPQKLYLSKVFFVSTDGGYTKVFFEIACYSNSFI